MTTGKISEKEALILYSDLIIPDIAVLEKSKSRSKDKRNEILNVLRNLKSVFSGLYFYYYCEHKSEPESEESIAERTKLRKQRSDEIAKKEKMINPELFREYFEYLRAGDMDKNLNKTTGSEEKKAQVSTIKYRLANLMEVFESNPTHDAKKLNTEIACWKLSNVFFTFDQLNKSGQGLVDA